MHRESDHVMLPIPKFRTLSLFTRENDPSLQKMRDRGNDERTPLQPLQTIIPHRHARPTADSKEIQEATPSSDMNQENTKNLVEGGSTRWRQLDL
jgi:hypothetical protein